MKLNLSRVKVLKKKMHVFICKIIGKSALSRSESYQLLLTKMNFTIQQGPFKGMKYIEKSNGSVLFPKIVGLYERSIQEVIELIVTSNYSNYVDIGCAEGYYAVGIAYRVSQSRKEFKVYAYDTDQDAINNLKDLAKLNGVLEFIEIGNFFNTTGFFRFESNTVVICDIEGEEVNLLDPSKCKNLLNLDLLIEVHDGGSKSDIIKNNLQKKFQDSHTINLLYHDEHNERIFKEIAFQQEKDFMNEGRKYGLEWMWLKHK